MQRATYLLPIRRKMFGRGDAEELRHYMSILQGSGCEVLAIDGSPPHVYTAYDRVWSGVCRHEPVDSSFGFLNDKVNGIHTGVKLAATGKIILGDDDIRYTAGDIDRVCELLDRYEVVRPQNYLAAPTTRAHPLLNSLANREEDAQRPAKERIPWWAKLEGARMLINRATLRTADYPGTCAFRRSTMLSGGVYDGDVLFDNEEIIRHFARGGAHICYANDLFIRKRPPTFRKWIEQRPRQAYEDFGLRFKTLLFASLLPLTLALAFTNAKWMSILLLSIPLAFAGWLRGAARHYFPISICLFAPLWVFERTLSTYWAFYWYLIHGGYPFGDRLLSKGIGRDWVAGGKIAARQ